MFYLLFLLTGCEKSSYRVSRHSIHICWGSYSNVLEEEKAALLQQIDSEFEKLKDEKPPAPTRRFKGDEEEEEDDSVEGGGEDGDDDGESGGSVVNLEDMVDRVNIR